MPTLKSERPTQKLTIESYTGGEPAHFTVYETLSITELSDYIMGSKTGKGERMRELMCKFVVEWDFTDESGNMVPITPENLGKIEGYDMGELMDMVDDVTRRFMFSKKKRMALENITEASSQ